MKLKNKKTGEIVNDGYIRESNDFYRNGKRTIAVFVRGENRPPERVSIGYETLAELNEEWEDYDDTKESWCISYIGNAKQYKEYVTGEDVELCKQIGNCFETKEEAEKAVEKLKAWKRLKNKGFRFDGYDVAHNSNGDLCGQLFYNAGDYCIEDAEKDLDLLFGGEK